MPEEEKPEVCKLFWRLFCNRMRRLRTYKYQPRFSNLGHTLKIWDVAMFMQADLFATERGAYVPCLSNLGHRSYKRMIYSFF